MSNFLQGSDHPSIVEVSDAGALAGITLWLRAQADGITLAQADSGKMVTPADGGGEVTLPASPTAGTEYDFVALSDDSPLTIHAQGLHKIMVEGSIGSAASSGNGGSRLRLTYAGPNAWVGLASGTWNVA